MDRCTINREPGNGGDVKERGRENTPREDKDVELRWPETQERQEHIIVGSNVKGGKADYLIKAQSFPQCWLGRGDSVEPWPVVICKLGPTLAFGDSRAGNKPLLRDRQAQFRRGAEVSIESIETITSFIGQRFQGNASLDNGEEFFFNYTEQNVYRWCKRWRRAARALMATIVVFLILRIRVWRHDRMERMRKETEKIAENGLDLENMKKSSNCDMAKEKTI